MKINLVGLKKEREMLRNGYQQIFSLDCYENQSRVTSKEREMLRNEIRADFQIADFGGKFKVKRN
jgi:hypothetical protein